MRLMLLCLCSLILVGCVVDRATRGTNSTKTNTKNEMFWEGEYEWVRPTGSSAQPPKGQPGIPGVDNGASAIPGIPVPPDGSSAKFVVRFKGMSRMTMLTVVLEELDTIALENSKTLTYAGIAVMIIGVGLGIYCRAIGVGVLGACVGTALCAYGYSKAFTIGVSAISMLIGAVYVIYKLKESADRKTTTVDASGKVAELEEEVRVLLAMLPSEKAEAYNSGRSTRAAAAMATRKRKVITVK